MCHMFLSKQSFSEYKNSANMHRKGGLPVRKNKNQFTCLEGRQKTYQINHDFCSSFASSTQAAFFRQTIKKSHEGLKKLVIFSLKFQTM